MNSKEIAKEIRLDNNTYPWSDKVQQLAQDYLGLKEKMEGHVLVPVEPTEERIKAMEWQIGGSENDPVKTWGTTRAIYQAAIGATNEN